MGVPAGAHPGRAVVALRVRFPGNVRELKNVIERALIESGGSAIEPAHLRLIGRPLRRVQTARETPPSPGLPLNLEEAEEALIQRALHETSGNVVAAAQLLGVNRSRIYRRFRQATG